MNGCHSDDTVINGDYKLCIICCHPFVLANQSENVEKISEFFEGIKNYHHDDIGIGPSVATGEKVHICEEILELEIRFGMSVCYTCLPKMSKMMTLKEKMGLLENHVLSLQVEIIKGLRELEKYKEKIDHHRETLRKSVNSSDMLTIKKRLRESIESNSLAFKLRQWTIKDVDNNIPKLQGNLWIPENHQENQVDAQEQVVANVEDENTVNFDVVDLTVDSGDDDDDDDKFVEKHVDDIQANILEIRIPENCDVETSEKIKTNLYPIQNKKNSQFAEPTHHCSLCTFSTGRFPSFEYHMRQHESEHDDTSLKSLQCPHCPSKFSTSQYYQFHINCHQGIHKMRCDICSKKVPILSLADHLKLHFSMEPSPPKIIYCQNCSFCCTSRQTYLIHSNYHISKTTNGKFSCDICSEEFSMLRYLIKHLNDKHEGSLEKWPCNFPNCNTVLYSKRTLAHHKCTHLREKTFSCSNCPMKFQRQKFLQSHRMRNHGAAKHKCKICEKEFYHLSTSLLHLRSHMAKQQDTNAIYCKNCGKSFSDEKAFENHACSHGKDNDTFCCDQCGKGFKSECHLKSHLNAHKDKNNWKCIYCGRAFQRKQFLKYHMRLHTGEKPLVCEICGMDFSWPTSLRTHRKKKHQI